MDKDTGGMGMDRDRDMGGMGMGMVMVMVRGTRIGHSQLTERLVIQ